ncbi:hypothetical protein ABFT23_11520 [Nocardioides sp. C4-1]|uniref:SCO6745 family protein n=1 Tax=Nocardioides sp. C4-1 TaxID=3151851 RepID=UPI003267546B
MDATVAGRTARTLETLHALCYFAPEVDAELVELGVRTGRTTYFASRAAPLGAVTPGVVAATFFVFNPSLVAKLLPPAWAAASPDDVVAARLRGVDTAYRRLLGDDALAAPEIAEAAGLARTAVEGADPAGRPLFAAHADLDWPDVPHLALWHGLTLLREFRGDGHIAALHAHGLSGIEALVTHTATGRGFTQPAAQATRAWSDEQWAAAVAGLAERELMTADGTLTAAGHDQRASVEQMTDDLAAAPWSRLGDDGAARLKAIGKPLVIKAIAAGAFPEGVFA